MSDKVKYEIEFRDTSLPADDCFNTLQRLRDLSEWFADNVNFKRRDVHLYMGRVGRGRQITY